jgi:hypothetical protein
MKLLVMLIIMLFFGTRSYAFTIATCEGTNSSLGYDPTSGFICNNPVPNQVNSDWNASSGTAQILNKPNNVSYCYEGITKHTNCVPYFGSGAVASGVLAFNMTVDGTSTGASIFPTNVIAGSIQVFCNDNAVPYPASVALSNSNKTLTASINKVGSSFLSLLGLNVLTAPAVANGTTCNIQAMGY